MKVQERDIREQMSRQGIPCHSEIVCDGKARRFKVDGRGKANGWYWFVVRNDKVYGVFGNWKTGERCKLGNITSEIRKAINLQVDDSRRRAETAALAANDEWVELTPSGVSKYLDRKKVPSFGLRFGQDSRHPYDNFVAVPMVVGDRIIGLQKIYGDGSKRFTPGCAKKGSSFVIVGDRSIVLVCEGYATGATLHMATGFEVVVGFDCGNMEPVVRSMLAEKTRPPLMIAGDNDHATVCQRHRKGRRLVPLDPMETRPKWCACNPGKSMALALARRHKLRWVVPDAKNLTGITDFNDLAAHLSIADVACQIYDQM